jgi:hypothetical protein
VIADSAHFTDRGESGERGEQNADHCHNEGDDTTTHLGPPRARLLLTESNIGECRLRVISATWEVQCQPSVTTLEIAVHVW